jgi:AraC-like DNA-binding protein
VHVWHVSDKPNGEGVIHRVANGFGHALLAPVVAQTFQALRVSAAVWEHAFQWFPIHTAPTPYSFEEAHGMDRERVRYNYRLLARAAREKRTVRGEHAGFSDLFVPIVASGKAIAILVTGPFSLARPSATQVRERWRWLTGRQADLGDPGFVSYLSLTLSSLVLDGRSLRTFRALVERLVRLMVGQGDAARLTNEAESLRTDLEGSRFVDRMWEATRSMVDDRYGQGWHGEARSKQRRHLGLSRVGDDVLVGLTVSSAKGGDPIDEAIRRDGFQRASVELARKVGNVVAGQVGDHGVVFLSSAAGSLSARQRHLRELADRARAQARQFDLALHSGITLGSTSALLSRSYQAALGAAESALARGSELLVANAERDRPSLAELRRSLRSGVEERPDLLAARFDRYLEAVAASHANHPELARVHLEVGFEQLALPLVGSGAIDAKSFATLSDTLERAAGEARSTSDLFAAYRSAVQDACHAVVEPVSARQERSLRRALDFIQEHYTEPLRLEKVARISGFGPGHFSRLFKRRESIPFENYLRALRLDHAKKLLADTSLTVMRVAELAGFQSPQYFCRAFREVIGVTPLAYRANPRPSAGKRVPSRSRRAATSDKYQSKVVKV